jgi:putative nucleotidyltransferase with HDIG domain
MRTKKPKRLKVEHLAPAGLFLFLSLLWGFLLNFPKPTPFGLAAALALAGLTTFIFYKEKALREILKEGGFWILAVASGLTVAVAKLGAAFNWFHLKECESFYYLLFVGAIHGPLFKTFLRRRREAFYALLGLNAVAVALASLNPFVAVAYLISNLVAADIYASRRDDMAKLLAVLAGNAIFAAVLAGHLLLKNPGGLVYLLLFYAVSTLTGAFLLFGLQKLIDLIPFMFSDEKLEAIANLSNPLVEEMLLKAPGTYHHSVMVSLLSESLAKKLGADPLITKVGAMFHDIGKLINPQYFIENLNGKNPHDELKPEVSASIIKSHVSEGIALARKYHLPEEIVRFIPEHQGTKLIKYFYHKALEQNGEADEERFRYPGPVPTSKETAIVMIADTVEAMVRALKNPTHEEIKRTVEKALELLTEEGQLEKSGLTRKELEKIKKHLSELLISYYHERIKYPEKRREEKKE